LEANLGQAYFAKYKFSRLLKGEIARFEKQFVDG
jgi:hypothetical protein